MTRGTLALLTKDGELYQSLEFNGDMYWDGYGEEAFNLMKDIETKEQFKDIVIHFNKTHHNYTDEEDYIYKCEPVEDFLNGFIKNKYFEHWFSDYIYFKNASGLDIMIKDYNGSNIVLKNGEVTILNFGEIYTPNE